MIKNVTLEETTFAEPPAKFEAGTPNVAEAVGPPPFLAPRWQSYPRLAAASV